MAMRHAAMLSCCNAAMLLCCHAAMLLWPRGCPPARAGARQQAAKVGAQRARIAGGQQRAVLLGGGDGHANAVRGAGQQRADVRGVARGAEGATQLHLRVARLLERHHAAVVGETEAVGGVGERRGRQQADDENPSLECFKKKEKGEFAC